MTESPKDANVFTVEFPPAWVSFSLRDTLRVLSTMALVLGSFTTLGSLALIYYTRSFPELDVIQRPGGLVLRALVFGVATVLCALSLWLLRGARKEEDPVQARLQPISRYAWGTLIALWLLSTALLCFRLDTYPWAAPDEVHHLNVARNLAVHGVYASGRPDGRLTYFDSFDSVGPAVIGPIAMLFKVLGVSLWTARFTMYCFFLLLSAATFQWCRRLYGAWSGVVAVGLLLGAFSSIYLGRTVYGEVPSFAYLMAGLIAWQAALDRPRPSVAGVAAGALVALAVLSKTIVVLVLLSFMGTWAYDRVTFRKIKWPHVILPAAGGFLVLFLWHVFQQFHGPGVRESGAVLAIYQHYLLFGLESALFAFKNSVLPNPGTHAVWFVIGILSIPQVFRNRYAPSAVVLYLYAIFMLYWWFFFTPGQIHRYLWNAYTILALFSAPWLIATAQATWDSTRRPALRFVSGVAVCCLILPPAHWISLQVVEITTKDEMAREMEIVRAVVEIPESQRVATSSGRLPGVLNFFADCSIGRGTDTLALLHEYDVVVAVDTPALRNALPPGIVLRTVGEFVFLSRPDGKVGQ